MKREDLNCPYCTCECRRDEVDIGIGIMYGPWGCPNCGWSENPDYDSREGIKRHGDDRVFDQYGSSHHVTRDNGLSILAGENVRNRGEVK